MARAPAGKLREYRRKRDFQRTPEPANSVPTTPASRALKFVIQEHHATHLHWDLRLEYNGVLLSWALPKGLPAAPAQNNLAVHTEDHPLEYLTFHGTIPEGNYGAGEMTIWDSGTYDLLKFEENKVVVDLHGGHARGKYALFQTRGKNWLIHRMDPPANPHHQPMPSSIIPMLAQLRDRHHLPRPESAWASEFKWDGVRAIAYISGGRVRLESRNQRDITNQYPELKALGESLGARAVVLDGEIIALDAQARPRFELLQQRIHVTSPALIKRRAAEVPITFMIFDLLYDDGEDLLRRPYEERRRRLEALKLRGQHWATPPAHVGGIAAALATAEAQQLEGVVLKRLDSTYEPGQRSSAWLKVKLHLRQELVIGGWLPGEGSRSGHIGALLTGYYDRPIAPQKLIYAGKVGTGFTDADLRRLLELLRPLQRSTSPFDIGTPRFKRMVFTEPQLVGEFEFTEWTRARNLRHPSFKGLRDDRDPRSVVMEWNAER